MISQTIDITTADGVAEAYVTRPDEGDHPPVLFYIDAIGLRPRIEEMADRIAGWGYTVLVPHVFYRQVSAADFMPKGDLLDPGAREAHMDLVRPTMAAHTVDEANRDAAAYVEALLALDGVRPGGMGVLGYCMGGVLALRTAAAFPDVVDAVGSFHAGRVVTDSPQSAHLLLGGIDAEVYIAHADHDASMPPEAIATTDAALAEAGVPYTSVVYTGAPHGFTMSDTSSYDEEAAERHFREVEALFARRLAG
jgi:carboxymethylenebutenolidase